MIEKGNICLPYHQFVAEGENSTNDDDLNKLDNITTHFDPEISTFSNDSSEESLELMDINDQNSEKIIEDSLPNYWNKSIKSQDNLGE